MAGLWRRGIDSVTSHCHHTAMPDDDRYSLTELADLAGVTPRTVRYYLRRACCPRSASPGPGSKYDAGHLARLRLIRRLQARAPAARRDPAAARELDDDEIRDLSGPSERRPAAGLRARLPAHGPRRLASRRPRRRAGAGARVAPARSVGRARWSPQRPLAPRPCRRVGQRRLAQPSSRPSRRRPPPAERPLPVGTHRPRARHRTPRPPAAARGRRTSRSTAS